MRKGMVLMIGLVVVFFAGMVGAEKVAVVPTTVESATVKRVVETNTVVRAAIEIESLRYTRRGQRVDVRVTDYDASGSKIGTRNLRFRLTESGLQILTDDGWVSANAAADEVKGIVSMITQARAATAAIAAKN